MRNQASAEQMSVLVVEDNPSDAAMILAYLAKGSHHQFVGKSVSRLSQALEELSLTQWDVALVDLTLPDASNLKAIETLTIAYPTLPIVVLTGLDDQSTAIRSLHQGAQDYLSKDEVNPAALERSIRYAIERNHIAVALSKSEKRFRALVDATSPVLWHANQSGRFVTEQKAWGEFTGQDWDDQAGSGWLDVFHAADREHARNEWDAANRLQADWEFSGRVYHNPTDEYRRCVVRAVPIRALDGKIEEWVGTITDVEVTLRAEEQLRRTERLAGLGTMAAGIAHEINNPILAAWTSAEAARHLAADDCDSMLHECLENIIRSVERCRSTVLNMLKLARGGSVDKESCDVREIIDAALRETNPYALEARVSICCDVSKSLPRLTANPVQLQQVFVTLLRNSVDASEPQQRICISSSSTEHQVVVSVVDEGEGMTDDEVERAFDPFVTGRLESGVGLGLSIAHGIVEAHNGNIALASSEGQGTTVSVTLPVGGKRAS